MRIYQAALILFLAFIFLRPANATKLSANTDGERDTRRGHDSPLYTLECPDDQSIFICSPDTICLPVGGVPDDAVVTVFPPSAWFDADNDAICFYTNCSVEKDLKVVVESESVNDSCMFTASVTMNYRPLVILAPDTSMVLCGPEEICIPAGISDINNNIEYIVISPAGYYNFITGKVCITPLTSGTNTIVVKAIDSCGAEDVDSVIVTVVMNSAPAVVAPSDTSAYFCSPEEICIPVNVIDFDNNVIDIAVLPIGYFDSDDSTACFTPDTAGTYTILIKATDICGAEGIASVTVNVKLDSPPVVVSAPDSTVLLCIMEEICFPVSISDPDDNIASIQVIGAGEYLDGEVCFTPPEPGSYSIIIEVIDECGNTAADTTIIDVILNSPPMVSCADAFDVFQCDFEEICFGVNASDPDDNIQSISTSLGMYDPENNQACFTPDSAGTYIIIVTVSDSCSLSAVDTTLVTVTTGERAEIICPEEPISESVCVGELICRQLEITPTDASVSTSFGTYADDELCFTADTSGVYTIEIIAEADCGADTCEIIFNVDAEPPPELNCPTDTTIELCGEGVVCRPVGVIPSQADVIAFPIGTYENGMVCFDVDSVGHYEIFIETETDCGIDSCSFIVDIVFNSPPEITSGDTSFFACEPGETFIHNIEVVDPEDDAITFGLLSAFGDIDANAGLLSFTADSSGTYCFMIEAADSCSADTADICITITLNTAPTVIAADDFSVEFCDPEEICFAVSIGDDDGNISTIEVNEGGIYSDSHACFTPDSSGNYNVVITVSDLCGAVDSDTTVINVSINSIPEITTGDTSLFNCELAEIYNYDIDAIDSDGDEITFRLLSPLGEIDSSSGLITFSVDTPGNYCFEVEASDSCGADIETVCVTIVLNSTPVVQSAPDTTIIVCMWTEICLPVSVSDIDDNLESIVTNVDPFADGQVCFTPTGLGTYHIITTATDSCGAVDEDTTIVTIEAGEAAVIDCPDEPIHRNICGPGRICVDLAIENYDEVSVNGAEWSEDQLCFNADTAGTYDFTVTATSVCGDAICELMVDVHIIEPPTACFTPIPDSGYSPLEVFFDNCSDCQGQCYYFWDFGDGSTSDEFEPYHIYDDNGCFTVTLIDSNECGSDMLEMINAVCVYDSQFVIPTNEWINIYCGIPSLDGIPLEAGDTITAYDPDSVLCGMGIVKDDGSYGFIPIYRDDIYSEEDEGAEPGDTIAFRINGVKTDTDPIIIWTENGDRLELCQFTTRHCTVINLVQGPNLISWNVNYSADIEEFIADFKDCIEVIQGFDQGGLSYDPDLVEFSTLKSVDYYHGYCFKMNCDVSFEMCSDPIGENEGIIIDSGWNLVSYWPDENLVVEEALAAILENVLVVLGFENGALTWAPAFVDFNTLTHMKPGFGYWIKSSTDDVLAYPGFSPSAHPVGPIRSGIVSASVAPSRLWMSIYGSQITLDGLELESNSVIEIYTGEGILCGSSHYRDGMLKLTPIYGCDGMNDVTSSYPKDGDMLSIQVNGSRVYPDIKWEGNGTRVRIENLFSGKNMSPDVLPEEYSLEQNYPNPFNPTTVIGFTLPGASDIRLEIYNVTGRKVRTLLDGTLEAGRHITEWDGRGGNGQLLASGVYFCRLTADEFVQTRKMLLMK